MKRQLISDERKARKFAGRVTAQMIQLGASPELMRRKKIPTSTFHGVFGGRHWERTTPREHAIELLEIYRRDFIFEERTEEEESI